MTSETFAERLKRLREDRGLTQRELGDRAGKMTGQAIYLMETGETDRPKKGNMEALARALKVSRFYLETGMDPEATGTEPIDPAVFLRSNGIDDPDVIESIEKIVRFAARQNQQRRESTEGGGGP